MHVVKLWILRLDPLITQKDYHQGYWYMALWRIGDYVRDFVVVFFFSDEDMVMEIK